MLSVQRATIQQAFERIGFTFAASTPLGKHERCLGKVADSSATVELVSKGDQLHSATMSVLLAPNALEVARTNGARMTGLLALVAPGIDGGKWLSWAMNGAAKRKEPTIEYHQRLGQVQVKLRMNKQTSTTVLMVQ